MLEIVEFSPAPIGFIWVEEGLRRTSSNLNLALCVSIAVGRKGKHGVWQRGPLGRSSASYPGTTYDRLQRGQLRLELLGSFSGSQ